MVNVLNRALAEETKNDVHNLFEEDSKWSRRNRPIDELKWLIQSSGEWSRDPKLKQLYVAVMQYHCQRHVHKPSCFKKNSGKAVECRYHFPLRPAVQSAIQFDTGMRLALTTGWISAGIWLAHFVVVDVICGCVGWSVQPKLSVRRRPVFAFLVQHMPAILSFVLSNTNLQYVANQLLTYYITCYQTKNSRDEAEAAQSVIHAFLQHIARRWGVENITHAKDRPDSKNDRKGSDWSDAKVRPDSKSDQKDNDCGNAKVDIKHPFAVGAGTVISLARKWTSNDTVPAQAAAFVNLQLGMFRFSHFHDRSTTIPVKQGIAFIEGQPINGRILSGGMWSNAVIDYSGRPVGEPFDRMSWYDYIKYYEVVPKVKSRSKQDAAAISEESGSDDESVDPPVIGSVSVPRKRGRAKRVTFPLGLHPKQSTHVVVKRKVDVMVTVSGARLKDEMKLNDLDSTDTDPPALFRDREDFAARVLVMFKPFRSMDDIRSVVDGNSYWRAYIRQRAVMLATDATMARYLHNSQSYYMDRGFEDQAALHEREEVDDPEMLKWRRQFRPDEEDGEADADSNEADDRSYMETQVEADADHGDPVVAVLRRAGMSVPNRAEHPTVVQASSLAAAMEVLADRKNVDPDRYVYQRRRRTSIRAGWWRICGCYLRVVC